MATLEERLQALEQEHQALEREHTELKKAIELQNIAIGALVNKSTLEKLNEKYDKIFEALIAHDRLTNERLGDIQIQLIEQDGKIVGLQTEMRQRFNEQDNKIANTTTKADIANMATKEDIATITNNMAAMENRIFQAFQQLATDLRAQRPQSE
jgi:hypothetical protein